MATIYRTGDTVVVGLKLENPPDQAPWVAAPARLTRLGVDGQPLGETWQLPVTLEWGPVGPGESARVAVQWEEPPGEPPPMVRLEVLDAAGRGLRWERLQVLPPVVEPQPAVPRERGRRREAP